MARATVLAVQLGVAVVLAPTADTVPFAARHLIPALPLATPLVALGLRRAPRAGVALALVTVAISAVLYVEAIGRRRAPRRLPPALEPPDEHARLVGVDPAP